MICERMFLAFKNYRGSVINPQELEFLLASAGNVKEYQQSNRKLSSKTYAKGKGHSRNNGSRSGKGAVHV